MARAHCAHDRNAAGRAEVRIYAGQGEYDGKFFATEEEFKSFAASAKSPVFVRLRERDLGRLSKAGVHFDAVLRNLDMVLVRVKK